ncbi:MAG TPA: filamentous hemagglutinin N-terminal domain-containing protein, partial [Allocoleopsis sp.]
MHIKTWQKSLFTLITGLSLLINTNYVQSQIIPDNTLGNENSKFTPGQFKDLIEGGAIRGNNLFHSFSQFNVNNNQQVYFTNPSGINNILTRVTGNSISNILGTLGVDGNANLFLINPNGIIFGQNAKLDIKGSFLASTANAIKFADNTIFSAKDTSTTPLLTMSVPVGVQWGNNPNGDITNNGNLTTGKDLTLSGRNVKSSGMLSTPDGKIELNAITEDVQVQQLNAVAATLTANQNINYGNITIENENPAVTNINTTLSLTAEKQITGTGNITTTTPGLLVNLQAKDNINIKDISSKGGNIIITSDSGDIITGILNSTYDLTNKTTTIDIDKGGIVNNNYTYFTFTSNITEPISDLKVRLSANNINSKRVFLYSPDQRSINLINSTGDNSTNFQDTLFTESASTPIASGSTPFNNQFQPSESLANLNHGNPKGIWYLGIDPVVSDQNTPQGTIYKAGETTPWGTTTGTQLIITSTNIVGTGGNVTLKAGGNISTGDIYSASGVNAG